MYNRQIIKKKNKNKTQWYVLTRHSIVTLRLTLKTFKYIFNRQITHKTNSWCIFAYPLTSYLKTSILSHSQTTNPQVIQKYLAAGVSNKQAMVGNDCQPQARLLTEVLQLVSQQLLSVVVIYLVAVLQQLQGKVQELTVESGSQPITFVHIHCQRGMCILIQ